MILQNTSAYPDHFLRRMLSWCIKQVDLDAKQLRRAKFKPTIQDRYSYRGRASRTWITVAIGSSRHFPVIASSYAKASKDPTTGEYQTFHCPYEALVAVTAHELQHVAHFSRGIRGRGSETIACAMERKVLRAFRENRSQLMQEWNDFDVKPSKPRPTKSVVEMRAEKSRKYLTEWERRLKLAKTKVQKYRRKVKYYDRVIVDKRGRVQAV